MEETEYRDLDAFLAALLSHRGEVGLDGAEGCTFKPLPDGRVEVTAGGFFEASGDRAVYAVRVGELSVRFGDDTRPPPHNLNFALVGAAFGRGPACEAALREGLPLDPEDQATIERGRAVTGRIREALDLLRVRSRDRLVGYRDDLGASSR